MNIWRVVGWISLAVSVMSAVSLVEGAFTEALSPYLQNLFGELIERYRNLRSATFHAVSIQFNGIVNVVARALTWFPPAPWFEIGPIVQDVLTVISLSIISIRNGVRQA